MLSAAVNIVGFNWVTSLAATELEIIVLDWLAKLLNLPPHFLSSARDIALKKYGKNSLKNLVVYASDQTHSALTKACKVGTTSSTAIDPLSDLGKIVKRYKMWFHVDAAYAGSACICPEYKQYFDGVEETDSINMSPHKWFLANLDCTTLWVKDRNALIQSLSTNPEYLKNKASEAKMVVDFKDWQIPFGRRFRSLKLWMVLRLYGVENIQKYIRYSVKLAKHFEGLVDKDPRFEIVTPRVFSLVCFRLLPPRKNKDGGDKLNRNLLDAVNATGKTCMSHTVLSEKYILRFAVGTPLTEEKHVNDAWKLLQDEASALLAN